MVALAGRHPAPRLNAAMLEAGSANAARGNGAVGPEYPLLGQGQPTPRELARSRFRAYFDGPAMVGPGRFSDQARILHIRGVGGATGFLHGDVNLGIVTPTDPNAPFQGLAVLQDKSTGSGAILGLDLSGSRTDVDARGRPTRMSFVSSPNIYGGGYTANSSSGTMTIKYHGNRAVVRFNGLVFTNGLTNPFANAHAIANGGYNP
jgi:hypothetical protein